MRYSVAIGAFLVIVGPWSVAAPNQAITISFDTSSVRASGITPGSQAAWFGVVLDRHGTANRMVRQQQLVAASPDGTATLALTNKAPAISIWAIVDLTTGEYAVASPGRATNRAIPFPTQAVLNDSQGRPAILASQSDLMAGLVARPGAGAWVQTVRRGAPLDPGHGADKLTRAALSSMQPVGNSPAAPSALQAGDVVIVINPLEMTFFAGRQGGPH